MTLPANLLVSTCDVVKKPSYSDSGADAYGQPNQAFTTVVTGVPCRKSTMGGGNEYKVGKEFAKNTFKFFMNVIAVDDANAPFSLTTHHWLRMGTSYFNITGVNDPSALGHHLEVIAEQVLP